MGRPLNVLFLMEDLCFGGTQRQTLALALRLDRERFLPAFLTLTGPTDLDDEVRGAGIPLRHLGKGREAGMGFVPGLCRALADGRPDILVPCTALPNIWGRLLGRLLRIPAIVGTCRGGGGPVRQHEWLCWRLAHHLVCNSDALVEALTALGVPGNRVTCIPNGVDTERFAPARPSPGSRPPVILCVGRLHGDKDHMTLLKAFARVRRQVPEARLRIVGDGPEEGAIRAWADARGAGAVELVPGTGAIQEEYGRGRLLALASVREGTPNVILEAMASGLPVCATRVGGIPALVEEGVTGMCCDAGNDAGMAANCLALLRDGEACDRMGAAGRERVLRDYAFGVMVRRHEDVFGQVALRGAS
jgi:glycosyltransferase involved in cell wall biosynthesis